MLEATVYDLNGRFLFLPFRVTFSKITFTQLTQYNPWQCRPPCIYSQHWDSTEKLPLNHDSLIPSDTDATSLKLLFPVRVLESYLLTANTGFRDVTLIVQWNIKEWFLGDEPRLWKDKQWAPCPFKVHNTEAFWGSTEQILEYLSEQRNAMQSLSMMLSNEKMLLSYKYVTRANYKFHSDVHHAFLLLMP